MDKIKLGIYGLQYSQTQTGAYALIMEEVEGNRRLPIIIGNTEAQAIAIELENMTPTRPLTHDLFRTFAQNFQIDIQEVVIYDFIDGIFKAKIVCSDGKNSSEIDCRPSDAIALAVRFKCNIYTHEFILDAAAIEKEGGGHEFSAISISDTPDPDEPPGSYSQFTDSELEEYLNEALEREDYEEATLIRDELEKRKK